MKKIAVRALLIAVFCAVLLSIVAYARGYRFSITDKKVVPTGIIVASSYPDGAQFFVDGKFKGATNSNISLIPGTYNIEIKKAGYSTWSDQITVKGEVVVKVDAFLTPQNPSLSPLTTLGVAKAKFFPFNDRVIILSEGIKPEPNTVILDEEQIAGVYTLDVGKKPLSIFNPLKLLVAKSQFPQNFAMKDADVTLSHDGKQMMFFIPASRLLTTSYLLPADEKTINPFDISRSKSTIEVAWKENEKKAIEKILETFKDPLPQIATDSFDIVSFSPDETKILYVAKKNQSLPIIVNPRLIGSNQTPEDRDLETGKLYVYDKKDDRNYPLPEILSQISSVGDKVANNLPEITNTKNLIASNIFWYPDSMHLVVKKGREIAIVDFDGTHQQTVYSGPFEEDFLAVSSDGKLLILANLNPQNNTLPDIYAVGIR